MTGYIQWPTEQEFQPGDVVLNGGMFWRLGKDERFRILEDDHFMPICSGCGQPMQPFFLKVHQRECEGGAR